MSKKKSPEKPGKTKNAPPKKVRELTESELEEISGGAHALRAADSTADEAFTSKIPMADATNIQLPNSKQNVTGRG